MAHPVILGIETSQRNGGVGLIDSTGAEYTEPLRATRRHDDDLMPAIDRLLKQTRLAPVGLEAVAVSVGPGGFTGLRIAVATAKILADTLGVAVAAVPSASIAANTTVADGMSGEGDLSGRDLLVLSACKGETFWATRMKHRDGRDDGWAIDGVPGLSQSDQLDLTGVGLLLGDSFVPERIRHRCAGSGVIVREPKLDPAVCARLGLALLDAGEVVDPLALSPIYAREPEAVRLWHGSSSSRCNT